MNPTFPIGILILAAAGLLASAEVGIAQGPIATLIVVAGAITALMFSVMKGKVGAMNGKGYVTDGSGEEVPTRLIRLTDQDKKEIVDMLFERIFAEVGRDLAKKAFLVLLACIFAFVGWLAKNHIDIK